jgi:hypothetical protein
VILLDRAKITVALAALSVAGIVAGCGSAGQGTSAGVGMVPARPPAPKPGPAGDQPVGSTFQLQDQDNRGDTTTYKVTLNRVIDAATPDNSADTPPAGDRLVGAEFTITGVTGTSQDDANGDATVQGTNNQIYQFGLEGLAAGTNFDGGSWSVGPGQTEAGWVSFEVPDSVGVATIKWTSGSDPFTSTVASWRVSPGSAGTPAHGTPAPAPTSPAPTTPLPQQQAPTERQQPPATPTGQPTQQQTQGPAPAPTGSNGLPVEPGGSANPCNGPNARNIGDCVPGGGVGGQ